MTRRPIDQAQGERLSLPRPQDTARNSANRRRIFGGTSHTLGTLIPADPTHKERRVAVGEPAQESRAEPEGRRGLRHQGTSRA